MRNVAVLLCTPGLAVSVCCLASQGGLEALLAQLLALPGAAPNARDKDGLAPLHWAASRGAAPLDAPALLVE